MPCRKLNEFERELARCINMFDKEGGSDTPDFILSIFLNDCLKAFNNVIQNRDAFYNAPAREKATDSPEKDKVINSNLTTKDCKGCTNEKPTYQEPEICSSCHEPVIPSYEDLMDKAEENRKKDEHVKELICPFCKGEELVVTDVHGSSELFYYVECLTCGAEGSKCRNAHLAVDTWASLIE